MQTQCWQFIQSSLQNARAINKPFNLHPSYQLWGNRERSYQILCRGTTKKKKKSRKERAKQVIRSDHN